MWVAILYCRFEWRIAMIKNVYSPSGTVNMLMEVRHNLLKVSMIEVFSNNEYSIMITSLLAVHVFAKIQHGCTQYFLSCLHLKTLTGQSAKSTAGEELILISVLWSLIQFISYHLIQKYSNYSKT